MRGSSNASATGTQTLGAMMRPNMGCSLVWDMCPKTTSDLLFELQGMDHYKLAKEAMESSGASGTVEYVGGSNVEPTGT